MIFELEKKPERHIALLGETGRAVTYGELIQAMEAIGARLKPGALLFCMCENVPEAVVGYLAALNRGVVPLLLGANLEEMMWRRFYDTYQPTYLWMPQKSFRTEYGCVEKLCVSKLCAPHRGRTGGGQTAGPVFRFGEYGLYICGNPPVRLHRDLALLLATSGSTGSPKLVRLSRRNLKANAFSIKSYLELNEKERPITTLPMQYTYGLSIINSHLLAGAAVLMTRASIMQQEFWDFFEKYKATSFGGVPYTYEMLKRLRFFERTETTLHAMTQAGGRLSPALQEEAARWGEKLGVRFYVMYGQTEATARMSYLPWEKCLEKPGSIGIPIPGGELYLVDERGKRLTEPGETGELIYEGPNVSMGYAERREDLALGDAWQGVLATGDLAWRDTEGCYYIAGRKKRFVKLYGIRIGLDECEKLLKEQFPRGEFACVGRAEKLCVYTTEKDLAETAPKWLAEVFHVSYRGIQGFYLKEFPQNEAGKLLYGALKESGAGL